MRSLLRQCALICVGAEVAVCESLLLYNIIEMLKETRMSGTSDINSPVFKIYFPAVSSPEKLTGVST